MTDAPPPPPYRPGPPPYRPGVDGPAVRERTRDRGPRWVLWISLGAAGLVLLVAIVAGVVLQTTASNAYGAAVVRWDDATDSLASSQGALASDAAARADAVATAEAVVAASPDGLVDVAARDAVAAAAAALDAEVVEATDVADTGVPDSPGARPALFWELRAAADRLDDETSDLEDRQEAVDEATTTLETDAAALDTSADALYASIDPLAGAFVAAHPNARNDEVIAFLDARDDVLAGFGVEAYAVDALGTYSSAATAVVASEQEELASIAGPLFDARRAVEEFARSIAGGVRLDFDWAPVVNGYGGSLGVGGLTYWNPSVGQYATIQFSDSTAEFWPESLSTSLIAHEVGHAIGTKCYDLLPGDDSASLEAWATAWALSLGYDGNGSGVQAYGAPPQSLIDVAATCR